ncbi:MAG: tryptophan 7-halogenase [Cellvibrionaceae bacterium]
MMKTHNTDVIIAGGGLAGLSLAKQLRMANNELDITVVEKRKFPIPNTTAKIGESTVEIGAHYFTENLKLKDHFREKHLQKHGLRCFFGEPQEDYSQQDELGVSQLFGIPTYQIERGVLENYLYNELKEQGVRVVDGATTESVALENKDQTITVQSDDGEVSYQGRWFVDATGRQELVKNKLGLKKETAHQGNAIWFRIDKRIVIDEWTEDEQWQNRLEKSGNRWRSTNHLMGQGYWCWIIPLGSGATSIGIVIDDEALEKSGISDFDDTLAWFKQQQPKLAAAIEGANLLDFNLVRNYSYGCKKMFSDEGWCLTGEAGAFTDPFYAPGSDFIALNNTFITHLIDRDKRGSDIRLDSAVFHMFYNSFFESTLSLYTNQYGGFGDRRMMGVKLLWDYAYYWGVLTVLFFKNTITDIDLMRELNPLLRRAQEANEEMQALLIERAKLRLVLPAKGLFMDQYLIPCLTRFNDILKAGDDIDTRSAIEENVEVLDKLLVSLSDMLKEDASTHISDEERELLGDYRSVVLA